MLFNQTSYYTWQRTSKTELTNGSLGADVPRVAHGVEDGPVAVHGDGDQAEDGDGAEHDYKRDDEETGVFLRRQAHTSEESTGDAEQTDEEVGDC